MPRKVILGFGISIDGYVARRNSAIDFLVMDKEGEVLMADLFAKIDTTVMGRKTAAVVAKNAQEWGDARHAGHGQLRNFPAMEAGQTRGIRSGEWISHNFCEKAKRRPGKDIYLGGGGELARSFLREDLVDELFLGVGPILLGDGIPAFPAKFPQRNFKLTECKS